MESSNHSADVATVENLAQQALTAFCWWRPDIAREVAEDYWRDVHGVLAARVPGLWQYRQLRLAPNRADLWPAIADIDYRAEPAEQPHGVPHALFLTDADLAAFGGNPIVTEHIFNDELNFVAIGATQMSPPGTARTLLDTIDEAQVQGPPATDSYAVFFRAGPESSLEDTHRYLTEDIAAAWAAVPGVGRVRVAPLAAYDPAGWDSPGVDHAWPVGRTYAGWIELAVAGDEAVGDLGDALVASKPGRFVSTVHTYPIDAIYTIVERGRPTQVGLRGYAPAATIMAAGAQTSDEVLAILYGDAPAGLARLHPIP